jgi:hypothetical protein
VRTDAEEEDIVTGLLLHSFFRILNFCRNFPTPLLVTTISIYATEFANTRACCPAPPTSECIRRQQEANEALKYSFSHA